MWSLWSLSQLQSCKERKSLLLGGTRRFSGDDYLCSRAQSESPGNCPCSLSILGGSQGLQGRTEDNVLSLCHWPEQRRLIDTKWRRQEQASTLLLVTQGARMSGWWVPAKAASKGLFQLLSTLISGQAHFPAQEPCLVSVLPSTTYL